MEEMNRVLLQFLLNKTTFPARHREAGAAFSWTNRERHNRGVRVSCDTTLFMMTIRGGSVQGIFISYRRDDTSAYSRLLYERLGQEFGQELVFMDVETIREPGADFVDAINAGVEKCTVLLALIGKDWLSCDSEGKRRLDDPEDFVRIEIASALKRDVLVIPVVVEAAKIPVADDLPEELKILARRQALKLSHEDWDYDIGKLIDALAKIPGFNRRNLNDGDSPPHQTPHRKGWSTGALAFTALAAVVAVLVVLGTLAINSDDSGGQDPEPNGDNNLAITTIPDPVIQPQIAPVKVYKPAYSEEVRTVQQSLVALDYNPGVIDGLMGNATVSAIRQFQSDAGHLVTGRVDATLRDQLYAEMKKRVESRIVKPTSPQPKVNLSGTWYDNFGGQFLFEQSGNSIHVSNMNLFTMQYSQIGSGRITGNKLSIRYQNLVASGTVIATLSADGQHLQGTDTPDGGNAVPNTWHYEHLPNY